MTKSVTNRRPLTSAPSRSRKQRTEAQRSCETITALEEQINDLMDNLGHAELGSRPSGPLYNNTCAALRQAIKPLQEVVVLLKEVRETEARRLPASYKS